MSAIDKTAQGTAVLEASGNAGAEAARRRRRLLMERRDAQLGKYRRYVRTSKGRLTGGRRRLLLKAPWVVLLGAGQAPWVVLLDAGQLRASGFLRRRISRPARMRMQIPIRSKRSTKPPIYGMSTKRTTTRQQKFYSTPAGRTKRKRPSLASAGASETTEFLMSHSRAPMLSIWN